jgi:hypothetical protein
MRDGGHVEQLADKSEWEGYRTPVRFIVYRDHLKHRDWLANKTLKQQDFEDQNHRSYWAISPSWTLKVLNPGPKTFICPLCERATVVEAVREEGYWAYYGACARCYTTWLNLIWAWRKTFVAPSEPLKKGSRNPSGDDLFRH